MYPFLLAVVVLLQSGKGGGLAAMGGSGTMPTEGILGGRQATNLLTRATWTSGTIFMVLALVLSIMSSRSALPTSVLRPDMPEATEPAPVLPGLTDEGAAVDPGAGQDAPAGAEAPGATGGEGN